METLLGRGGQGASRITQQVRDRPSWTRRPQGRLCLHLYPSKAFSRVRPPGPPHLGQPFGSRGHPQPRLGFSLKPLPPEAETRGPLGQRSEGQGDHLAQAQTVSPLRLKAPGTPALAARNASFVAEIILISVRDTEAQRELRAGEPGAGIRTQILCPPIPSEYQEMGGDGSHLSQ